MPTVQAIVLRRRDSGETDRRLTILTPERGKVDVVAKGARKPASRLAGISDPLCVSRLEVAEGKRNLFITQAQPMRSFPGLRSDYERLSFALSLCELYAAVLPWEEALPEAYPLLTQSLGFLEGHPKPIVATVWAQVRLLSLSGFMPQFDRCVVSDVSVGEAEAFLSPQAGGYVAPEPARTFSDRFLARAEVLYGLARLPELDTPPMNLRFAAESLIALLPFWRTIAETALLANEASVGDVRQREG
jgi:DNA repair protein RecO (recombination protein O)